MTNPLEERVARAIFDAICPKARWMLPYETVAAFGDAVLFQNAAKAVLSLLQSDRDRLVEGFKAAAWKWAVADLALDPDDHDWSSLEGRFREASQLLSSLTGSDDE